MIVISFDRIICLVVAVVHRVIAALKHWDMGENPITFIDFDNFFFKIKMNSEMV